MMTKMHLTQFASRGDSNEIDNSKWHARKQKGPRISIEDGIVILDEFGKLHINL
jgi:hypothetical protein